MTGAGTLSFLFADLREYTAFVEAHGDAAAAMLIADYRRLIRSEVARRSGGEIKTEGDSFYVVFPSATRALQAAIGVLRKAERRSRQRPDRPLRIGIGIHAGEPVAQEGQYVGSAVNVAARLAQQAGPGELLVSELVRGLLRTSSAPSMHERRGLVLKGIHEPLRVFAVAYDGGPTEPDRSLPGGVPSSFLKPLSAFVGRARDLVEVAHLLESHRLVTVTGPGGVGKTRVALEAARGMAPSAGCFLVELSGVGEDRSVAAAFAQAVGASERPRTELLHVVGEHLAGASLLVVDNCEHVLDGVTATTAAMLQSCPRLRVLATSREALQLPGEATWPLGPLPSGEAVELFTVRALEADPAFRAEGPEVTRLCARLEGLPLAIELAAARAPALTVGQMLERLEDRFRLLSSTARTTVARQRTLEATIDWSYQLLNPGEQSLFRRLAVFRGGLTLEAAEAVCGIDHLSGEEILDLLAALVRRSLVVAFEVRSAKRYRLLDTIQAFAASRLTEANEAERLRENHAHFFVTWALAAREGVLGPDQDAWLHALDAEIGNLRAAANQLRGRGDDGELTLCDAMHLHAFNRSGTDEALNQYEQALSSSRHSTLARARAMLGMAWLEWQLDHDEEAARLAESALQLSRNPECEFLPWALSTLAAIRRSQGRKDEARELSQEALDIGLRQGDQRGIRMAHGGLFHSELDAGNIDAARHHAEEELAVAKRIGTPTAIAGALRNLSVISIQLGDPASGKDLLLESVRWSRGTASNLKGMFSLVRLALANSDYEGARAYLAEEVAAVREYNLSPGGVLAIAAMVESDLNPTRAMKLAGAASGPLGNLSADDPWLEPIHKAEARLGLREAQAAREVGRRLSLEEALELVLTLEPEPTQAQQPRGSCC